MSEDVKQSLANGSVRIEVIGRPRTKGSLVPEHKKIAPGKCRVTLRESGEYSVPWKNEMIRAIRNQCTVNRYPHAVVVDTFFRFERLCLPDQAMPWPTRERGEFAHGDEDKLRRNALDALTQSGLIFDDALVIGGTTLKRFARNDEGPGVDIRVTPVNDQAPLIMLER